MNFNRDNVFSATFSALFSITLLYFGFIAVSYVLLQWIGPIVGLRYPYLPVALFVFSLIYVMRSILMDVGDVLFPNYGHKPFDIFSSVLTIIALLLVFLHLYPSEIGLPNSWNRYAPAAQYQWISEQLPALGRILLVLKNISLTVGLVVTLSATYLMFAVAWNLPHPDIYDPDAGKQLEKANKEYWELDTANNRKAKQIEKLSEENSNLKTTLEEEKRRREAEYGAWINDRGTVEASRRAISTLEEEIKALKTENDDLKQTVEYLRTQKRNEPKHPTEKEPSSETLSKLQQLVEPKQSSDD